MITVRFLNTITGSSTVRTRIFESEGTYLQWLQTVRTIVEVVSVSAAATTYTDERLTADADACLAFLIAHQGEWGASMDDPGKGTGLWAQRPVTLVAIPREEAS